MVHDTIRANECCPCDKCGRELAVGDAVAVDLEAGAIFCADCAVPNFRPIGRKLNATNRRECCDLSPQNQLESRP